jgi:hypothetical protein
VGVFEDDHTNEQAIAEALQRDDIGFNQLNDFNNDEDDDLFDEYHHLFSALYSSVGFEIGFAV